MLKFNEYNDKGIFELQKFVIVVSSYARKEDVAQSSFWALWSIINKIWRRDVKKYFIFFAGFRF